MNPSVRRYLIPLSLLALLPLSGCRSEPTAPVYTPVSQYSIEQFLDTQIYRGASFSPDNSKLLVSGDQSGVFNAYAVPVSGGDPVPLTQSTEESIFALGYFPGDERFLYRADQGGNELDHVYVRELDGSTRDLTPGEDLKARYVGFLRDAKSFLLATNERDAKYFDIYEHDITTYERKLIYRDDVGYFFGDISDDRRYLAFTHVIDNADSDIYLFDRQTEEMKLITPQEGEINHRAVRFSPDSSSLLLTTDQDSEFTYLVNYNLESGERSVVEKVDWDVVGARYSTAGNYLTVTINRDARTEVKLYDGNSLEPVALPSLPDADINNLVISRDETYLAFYGSNSRSPRDLFVAPLTSSAEPRKLTRSLSAEIADEDLVDAEVVRFASFDGVEIPGILFKPKQAAEPGAKLPALVWVHGGPGGQSRVGYRPLLQYLINHGYVIYAINNRGSSGYGKTFFHLDDRNHGKGDLQDCIASKQMLIDTGYVDPDRIGIIGGSYGGFMVLAALAFEPEEFALGVDIFGVSNWLRTTQSIPPWWEAQRKALERELGDFDDEDYLRSISPLFHANNIVKPLMVLQGANDPRVLKAESDDIVAAARANGVDVEYLVFEDEGHGFRKKENQARGYRAVREFLDRHFKAPATAP